MARIKTIRNMAERLSLVNTIGPSKMVLLENRLDLEVSNEVRDLLRRYKVASIDDSAAPSAIRIANDCKTLLLRFVGVASHSRDRSLRL